MPEMPASGYLVTAGADSVLLDIGPGVFPALLALDAVPGAIFLSHRHHDHCLDLLPLFNYLRFDRGDDWGIPVFAPRGLLDSVAAFAGAGPGHDFFRVFDGAVVAPGDTATVGSLTLEFGAAVHPVPALCVRVGSTDAAMAYSGDTGPGGDLTALAAGAGTLLCEATHQGEPSDERNPFHLYAAEAGAIAAAAGVARLLVTHVAPSLDPRSSVAEASAVFGGPVEHAAAGLEVEV